MYGREKGEVRKGERRSKKRMEEGGRTEVKNRRWKEEKEGGEKDNASHRETVESRVVVQREDVSTIEMEVVHVRSIRIGSS